MLRKKFYKILSVLVVIIITSSLFLIPVSARDNPNGYWINGVKVSSIDLELYTSSGEYVDFDFFIVNANLENKIEISLKRPSGDFLPSELFYVRLNLDISSDLVTYDNYLIGTYSITTNTYNEVIENPLQVFRWGYKSNIETVDDYYIQSAETDLLHIYNPSGGVYNDGYKATFPAGVLGVNYNSYNNYFYLRPSRQREFMTFTIFDIDFKVLTPAELAAEGIIENQNRIYSDLVDGWVSDSNLDTKTFDDYKAQEDKILADSSQGRSEAVSLFNNFHFDANLQQGLYCATAILTEFVGNTDSSWFHSLLKIGLVIGIFGFVIGTAQLVVVKFSSKRGK